MEANTLIRKIHMNCPLFVDYKANEIVDYMHEETAYTKPNPGDIIPFSLTKEIREF